jgi:hypothetical protein
MTECIPTLFGFQDLGSREVIAVSVGQQVVHFVGQ